MSGSAPISLTTQADAVENAALSHEAWLKQASSRRKDPLTAFQIETERRFIAELRAAHATLRAIIPVQDDVRALIAGERGRAAS